MNEVILINSSFIASVIAFVIIWAINIISVGISKDKLVTSKEGTIIAFSRFLLLAASFAGIIIYIINPDAMTWSSIQLPTFIRWVGFGITIISLMLFSWVLRSLGKNFSTSLTIRKDQSLIETGLYKWVRHPMYTIFILIWLGFLLHSGNLFIGLTGIVCFRLTIWFRTPIEEKMMIEKFGKQYTEYMKRTGAFLPKIK